MRSYPAGAVCLKYETGRRGTCVFRRPGVGRVAEWSKAAVLKTAVPCPGTVGSNPTPSAFPPKHNVWLDESLFFTGPLPAAGVELPCRTDQEAPAGFLSRIPYVLRTGCPWKAVPWVFGSGSTLLRYHQFLACTLFPFRAADVWG